MQNLKNNEDIYNAHMDAYGRAYYNNQDFLIEHEEGYLKGVEDILTLLGIEYKIDTFGRITIEKGLNND